MKTDDNDLLKRLFAAARAAEHEPSPREEGFEARLMTRLRQRQETELPWYAWAWRCSPVFAAVVVVLMIGSGITSRNTELDLSHTLNGNYETATIISYLTGE
jgi:type VI protein secretion system component VasF